MNISCGTILISSPSLADENFKKAVIFITEYNEKGAVGFVINRVFDRVFSELVEFKNSPPFPLFNGGPVEQEKLFCLHRRPDLIEGSTLVTDSIYIGGNFKQVVSYINGAIIQQSEIKLFIGYCGWDKNELEEEIQEGSWLISNTDKKIVFNYNVENLWQKLYKEVLD